VVVKYAKGINVRENVTSIDVIRIHLKFFTVQNIMEGYHVIIKDKTLTL